MIREDVLTNQRGVALILTIMVVSFIIALSLEFNRTMRTQVVSTSNVGHGLKALYAAKSGIAYGLSMLQEDRREVDSFRDDWAMPETLTAMSDASKNLLGGASFELTIEDLSGKIPINLVIDNDNVQEVFKKFLNLERFGLDTDTVNTVFDSTLDWIDGANEDDESYRLNGAENDYYQSLERPYECKNGPLDSPKELLLVKGMTPEIFDGTDETPGIGVFISVYGDDKPVINVNTAAPAVLESLSSEYDGETLAGFREDATEAELESGEWYKDKINKNYESIVSRTSIYFQIVSVGQFGDAKKQAICVVRRDPDSGEIRTLSRKIE